MNSEDGLLPTGQITLPGFFDDEPELLEMVKEGLHRPGAGVHSGGYAIRDLERCRGIAEDMLAGRTQRDIARRWRVSRNTLAGIMDLLEAMGEVEPIKERLIHRFQRLAESAAEALQEKVYQDKVPVNVLPFVMGIATDKSTHLAGLATPGDPGAKRDLDLEGFKAQLKAAKATIIDVSPVE